MKILSFNDFCNESSQAFDDYKNTVNEFEQYFDDCLNYINADENTKNEMTDSGFRPYILITGKPGMGKSKLVENAIKKHDLIRNRDYIDFGGVNLRNPIEYFETNERTMNKIVIFDDVLSIFNNKNLAFFKNTKTPNNVYIIIAYTGDKLFGSDNNNKAFLARTRVFAFDNFNGVLAWEVDKEQLERKKQEFPEDAEHIDAYIQYIDSLPVESLDNYNFRISQRAIAKMKMGRNWKYDVDSMLQL